MHLISGKACSFGCCRSQDYTALLYAFNQLFGKVEATKPAASRNTSAEIFVVCLGFKAPSKIDPRLLDPKHLFKASCPSVSLQFASAHLFQGLKAWATILLALVSLKLKTGVRHTCLGPGGRSVELQVSALSSACFEWHADRLAGLQEIQEAPKIMGPDALLKQKIKQRRHREGYEEGLSSTYRPLPAAAFITSDKPVELLGLHSR